MLYIKATIFSLLTVFLTAQHPAIAKTSLTEFAQDQSLSVIAVRKGEHLNYSRIVFDFTNSVVYSASYGAGKLTVSFDVNFTPDFGLLVPEPLRWISNPIVSQSDGLMTITFDVNDNSEILHSYAGTKVYIDVYDPTAAKGEGELAPIVVEDPIIPEATPAEPEPEVTNLTVTPRYEETREGVKIVYPTKISTATAVFKRGDILWLIFETLVPFDHSNYETVNPFIKGRLAAMDLNIFEGATIVQYNIKPGQFIGVEREGPDWIVNIQDTATAPKNPLTPIKQMTSEDDFRVFVPATDIGTRLEIIDPLVGDNLSIIPLRNSSRGLATDRDYSRFRLPATAQGLVVQRISDQLSVYRYRNGIAIGDKGDDAQSIPGGNIGPDGREVTVDFNSWRQGNAANFKTIESELLYRMASSNTDRRNAARWNLARFYLAHNRASDASGLLEQMLDDDSQLSSQPSFRAVRGIAHTKLHHYDSALEDFEMRELNSDRDIALWRAQIYQMNGENEKAIASFENGRDAIGNYDALERAGFFLSSARAYFSVDNYNKAEFELDQLAGHRLILGQMREMELLRAEIALGRGQGEVAMAALNDLSRSRDRSISSRARYIRLLYKMDAGAITRADAIEEMERIRYIWRGDEFEMNLLRQLGDIYLENQNYQEGLDAMRQVVTYFSNSDLAKETSNHMTDVFRDLYLNCKADTLAPEVALGLYYQYKELTPFGSEGDRLIRRIADRLIALDLFDPAIDFLDYQIRDRVEAGVARAQVAANLGKIYLLDGRAEEALQILRATRTPNMPRDLEISRTLIEGRALYEAERFEEAEVLITTIDNLIADHLRADIYWRSTDWNNVIAINSKILGNGWREKEELDVEKRIMLIRLSIAYTFNNDVANLAMLRGRYLEQILEGDLAASFDLLTNPDGLSSRDIANIIGEIDDVNNVASYLQAYRDDFVTSDCEPLIEESFDQGQRILGTEN